ncbi:MAG: hypothetical protein VYA97_07025 [Pseudomonadota bacterium]|nr:hypothetical protein [Pseudomonadota bacterium]
MPTALYRPVLRAATFYSAAVFFCGFVLGSLRIFVLLPLMDELWAVSLELPIMLTLSWLIARHLTRNRKDLYPAAARLWMGIWAFGLLMVAEYVLATTLMGAAPSSYFGHWATAAGAIGLAGQIAFALIPFIQRITRRETP